jgi:hypothetical protein
MSLFLSQLYNLYIDHLDVPFHLKPSEFGWLKNPRFFLCGLVVLYAFMEVSRKKGDFGKFYFPA